MKNLILTFFLIIIVTLTGWAQDSKMTAFSDLVGQWKGTAKTRDQNGMTMIDQTEEISYELNGTLLVIKGTGMLQGTDSVAFRAYGVIHWDKSSQEYKFSAYTEDGNYILADAYFENEDFVWEFQVPTGRIQYTLHFTSDSWIEDGKYSPDGQQWYPFFHMELTKTY